MQSLLQEQYLKSLAGIEDGQIVTGTVVQLNDDYVFVDVGYKSEGKIPVDEFIELPKLGDKVNVVIVNKEGKGGQVIVSKKKADAKERTEALREAAENKSTESRIPRLSSARPTTSSSTSSMRRAR